MVSVVSRAAPGKPPRLFTQPDLDVHQRRPAEDGLGQSGVAEGVRQSPDAATRRARSA